MSDTPKIITPFANFCLQNFPFIEATYQTENNYELLCKVIEKLNEVVNNSNATTTLVNKLNDWFKNLDVQDEINNKLDEMAESGELTDIIAQYLKLAGVLSYNTIADMKSAKNLANGSTAYTLGAENYLDGDGSFYKIRTITSEDVVDEYNIVSLDISNTLIAERVYFKKLRYYKVKTTDSFDTIINYFNNTDCKIIEFETGNYTFTDLVVLNSNTKVLFNNSIINSTYREPTFNDNIAFMNYNYNSQFTEYKGNSNIELYDGIFNTAFALLHGSNIKIINCKFNDEIKSHAIQMSACKNVIIKDCQFDGTLTLDDSSSEEKKDNQEIIQLDYCIYEAQPFADKSSAMWDKTPNRDILIENCNFKEPTEENKTHYVSIGSHTNSDENEIYNYNIFVENNIFTKPKKRAIKLKYTDNAIINNNNFNLLNTGNGVSLYQTNTNIKIDNNIFNNGKNFFSSDSDNASLLNKNIIISNNNFKDSNDNNGMLILGYIQECKILNNLINNFTKRFIYSHYDINTIIIENNTIINNNNTTCIYFDKDSSSTQENIILNSNNIILQNSGYFIGFSGGQSNIYSNGNVINLKNRFFDKNHQSISFENIMDSLVNLYSGNIFTGTISPSVPFSNFNKLIVIVGGGSNTNVISLYGWDIINKIDARTYEIPSNVGYASLTINSDGTFTYDGTSNNINLRSIVGANE